MLFSPSLYATFPQLTHKVIHILFFVNTGVNAAP